MKQLKLITKIAAISVIVILLAISCKEDCPAFPKHLIDYYPYKTGDILKFENSNNDTIEYIVRGISITEKHSIDGGCSKCACEGPLLYFLAEDMNYDSINGEIIGGIINLNIHYNYLVAYANKNKDFFNPKDSLLFGKTVILEPLPHNQGNISYAKVIKGEGIVEFFDTDNNWLWKKTD